jgi:hypothetical protein
MNQVAASMAGWLTEFHKEYGRKDEPAPVPTLDPAENRLLQWNLTVRYADTYVRWVEKLDDSEMVVLHHNHADKITQKNDDGDATPDLTTRPQPRLEVLSSSQQRDVRPEKPARPKSFPEHWGTPPMRQTKDLRPLPGGYGRGSSTLSKWIKQKLREDERAQGGEE